MAVLKFNKIFGDVLLAVKDGEPRKLKYICDFVAERRNLSAEDRSKILEKSGQTVLSNRVGWARTYLKMAGLVEYSQRAFVKITEEGKKILDENKTVDLDLLRTYKSFRDFQSRSSNNDNNDNETTHVETAADDRENNIITPQEQFENAFKKINASLSDEILGEILKLSPAFFENLTSELLKKMGYGNGTVTKKSNDGGIDVIISEDKLGLRNIYIQAKRYALDGSVGRPEIQGFVGAISNKDGKGVFITTANFSDGAKQYAKENHIVLIDGEKLAALMIEYGVGVSTFQIYEIKRLDSDFFTEF